MAFFDNIGKKVGDIAQTAAKKSSDLVETTKINMNINSEEESIKNLYKEIGEVFYEKYGSNPGNDGVIVALCEKIRAHEETIKDLKEKSNEKKNINICPTCGDEVEKEKAFCGKCGADMSIKN